MLRPGSFPRRHSIKASGGWQTVLLQFTRNCSRIDADQTATNQKLAGHTSGRSVTAATGVLKLLLFPVHEHSRNSRFRSSVCLSGLLADLQGRRQGILALVKTFQPM